MKAGVLAIAAAIASGVSAHGNHNGRRHAHQAMHVERNMLMTTGSSPEPTCGCTTVYYTVTGEAILHNAPTPGTIPPPAPSTTEIPTPTSSPAPVVPTPFVQTCPTPGVYTIPATTITVTSETTVCGATSTHVPAGTHTAGGVTTVVETSTTIVCPYATTTSKPGEVVVTSVILTTTYVCPSAGTYTIAPLTTTVSESTVWVYPTPATYPAGTYTQNEVVTTVTETDYVFFCPFTSPAPAPAPAPTYAPAPAPAPAPVYSAVPEAPKPAQGGSSGGSLSNGHLGSSGDMWGLTYTPYDAAGNCKTPEAVFADIKIIKSKGFSVVRVYATNCGALKSIGDACANEDIKLKMILGVFIEKDTGIAGAQSQVNDIMAWKQWDLVELIVIGNEASMSGAASPSALAGFISSAKSQFQGAGYPGPCTTAEPLDQWQANAGLWCGVVDVVGLNIHAFFNAQTVAENAGPFVKGQLDIGDNLCSGKYAVNLESGWPSSANKCNGLACAGQKQQADAIKSIKDTVGGRSVMFSYQNDPWKPAGVWDCENHWGVIQLF